MTQYDRATLVGFIAGSVIAAAICYVIVWADEYDQFRMMSGIGVIFAFLIIAIWVAMTQAPKIKKLASWKRRGWFPALALTIGVFGGIFSADLGSTFFDVSGPIGFAAIWCVCVAAIWETTSPYRPE